MPLDAPIGRNGRPAGATLAARSGLDPFGQRELALGGPKDRGRMPWASGPRLAGISDTDSDTDSGFFSSKAIQGRKKAGRSPPLCAAESVRARAP
jgi:hypothetical protein